MSEMFDVLLGYEFRLSWPRHNNWNLSSLSATYGFPRCVVAHRKRSLIRGIIQAPKPALAKKPRQLDNSHHVARWLKINPAYHGQEL